VLTRLRLWLRSLVFGRRLEREMREEMAAHLNRTVERFKAQGLGHADARLAARREFGNVDALRDDARDARGGRWRDSAVADLRYGCRQFARRPFSTITMIAVLALGIGFNSALFLLVTTLVDSVPPGITPEESLVRVRGGDRSGGRSFTIGREFSYPDFREYAAQTALVSTVAAWTSADVALDVGRDREHLHSGAATYVTANYFQVLGVRPAAALGLFMIWALVRAFESAIPDLHVTLDWRNLTFTAGVALAAGILFGLSPALHATRLSLADILKDAASAFVPSRSRLQAGLVVAQIALTQPALLAMGALLLEMVRGVRDLPASVRADRILDVRFNTNPRYGAMDDKRERALARLQARFAALPGVVAVVPQENSDDSADLAVHTMDQAPGVDLQSGEQVRMHAAPPGYFAMMSMPFVLGRDFNPAGTDGDGSIIIGAGTARRLWGDADPIGRRLVNTGFSQRRTRGYTVVGVVDDSRAGGSARANVRVFVPDVRVTGHFLVQTSDAAQGLAPTIRSVANSDAPEMPIVSARTLAVVEAGERTTFVRAIAAAGGSGAVALLLSAIGLYAMISFAVGQRVREIGIRTALGADHRRLLLLFLRRGLGLSLAGVAVGVALSIVVMRVVAAMSGEEPPAGTAAIALATTTVVAGVALLATWIPARHATRIDPLQALRLD